MENFNPPVENFYFPKQGIYKSISLPLLTIWFRFRIG
jgi:hypothetical protein